jgi:hypothetical protein
LPRTVDRYLEAAALDPYRPALAERILAVLERRFRATGLFQRKDETMMTLIRRDQEAGR